ncbi:7323_t:CDS:2 [Dentiscutata heterogama]|uniref:7323_t:CDS:1 n=1 Tax=Dentiscutata heterogama TaxID=1316150 RepID=A0ACA9KCV7_9GLOM|nr:7323_t:CDS:2 [Dentiscutata heterogama]
MSTPLQVERQLPSLSHSSYSLSEQQHSASLANVEQPQNFFGHMPSQSSCSTPYSSPSSRIRTVADSDSTKQSGSSSTMRLANTSLGTDDNGSAIMKRTNKTHVPSACVNCKRAHLACDVSRPCKRCVALNKVDTCIDIKHKKRGRPKLKDKKPHPYNTHATGDAKTWVSSTQFLPPTTTNPSPRNPQISPTITMFLTTAGAHCAKVSDECLVNMGYYPYELVHKSLYEYVPPPDCERLQKLIDSLLENAHRYYHTLQSTHQYTYQPPSFDHPVTSDDSGFCHATPEQLQIPAYGTLIEAADMIHLKQRNGQYDLYNVKTYLGGGLGADLTRKDTWSKLYVVAFFTRVKTGACVQNDCSIYTQSRISNISNINNINGAVNSFSTSNTPSTITTIDPALLTMNHPSNDNVSSSIGTGKFGLLSPVLSPRQGLSELNPSSIYIEAPPPPPNPQDFHSHQRASHYSTSFTSVTQNIPRSDSPSQPSSSVLSDRRSLSSRSSNNTSFYHEMDTKPIIDSSFEHNQLDRSLQYHHIPANSDVSQSTPQFSNDEHKSIISRDSESRVNPLGTESDSTSVTRMSVNSLLC